MSLLAAGRYKEPYTRLPTKLPNLNRLSVPATPTKDLISSGGNPISYAPPTVPSRTINVFNQLERKEPKQKRISDLMELFLQVQKNKFIKEGVIQQAFKPEKHSNNLNYLASTNPDRAKEKMINALEEALITKTYNKHDGRLKLEPTEDIQITAEEISKADPNINAAAAEEDLKQTEDELERFKKELEKIDTKGGAMLPKKLTNQKIVLEAAEKLEKEGSVGLNLLNTLESQYTNFLTESLENNLKPETIKSRKNILNKIRAIRNQAFKEQQKLAQKLPRAPQEPPLPPPLTTPLTTSLASAEPEDQTQEQKKKLAIAEANL